jgi:hypothetical protein
MVMIGGKTQRRGGKTRRSGKGRKLRNTRKNRRHHQRGGFTEVCGPVADGSGAGCNAGSGSNYVISMFGDAYTQLKNAISNMF